MLPNCGQVLLICLKNVISLVFDVFLTRDNI